jgi:hypothetical protein
VSDTAAFEFCCSATLASADRPAEKLSWRYDHALIQFLTLGVEQRRRRYRQLNVLSRTRCRLLDVASASTALQDAFALADDVLRQGVQVSPRHLG